LRRLGVGRSTASWSSQSSPVRLTSPLVPLSSSSKLTFLSFSTACAAAGYYLRTRADDRIAESAAAVAASSVPVAGGAGEERAVRERIAALRRRENELEMEAKELKTKLDRAKAREQRV
jgi:hypothetical protein